MQFRGPLASKAVVVHPDAQKRMESDPEFAKEVMARIEAWWALDNARNEALSPGWTATMSQGVVIGKDGSIVNAVSGGGGGGGRITQSGSEVDWWDIYIPSKRIAIEYDGYTWHKDNKSEIKKNELCIENNIQLVRIREEGLKAYNDCTCIIRKDRKNNNSLNGVISLLFQAISCSETIDIDVDRDEGKIYETYISSQKDNSLERKSPNIATEWHPTKNGKLRPDMVSYGSKKKVWWLGKCGHEWQATVDSRSRGNGCPICANQQLLVGFNDLATVSPNVAREWHPTKNGSLEPTMVSPKANKKVWWLGKCGHEWEALISSRTNGRGCPYCSNKAILPGFNDLETINPELASEWHPVKNGSLTASSVSPKSSKKVWWLGKCGHEWQATVNDRANGTGCPVCRRKKLS